MCGILGYIGHEKIDDKVFFNSLKLLSKRGPDNISKIGFEFDNLNFQLGHTRLSIIDLDKRSNQPMKVNQTILIYNGEIYNFKFLRKKYLKGIRLETKSDTEVILQLYLKFGIEKTLDLIEGIFAFSIIDLKEKLVYLCRDQSGVKPLYYFLIDRNLYFSSEIKSFKKFDINFNVSKRSLSSLYYNRHIPPDLSIYENINPVIPSHLVKYDLKNFSFEQRSFENISLKNVHNDEGEIIKHLDKLIYESVKSNMLSDVNLCVSFSGGLDSSIILAIAKEINPKIKAFTVKRGDDDIDYIFSKKICNYLSVDQEIIDFSTFNKEENFRELFSYYDQPIMCSSIFSTFCLYQSISKKNFKVCLTGDGADEIFSGYEWHRNYNIMKGKFNRINFKEIIKYFYYNLKFLNHSNLDSYKKLVLDRFNEEEVFDVIKSNKFKPSFEYENILNDIQSIKDLMYIDYKLFLNYNLFRTDMSSMANSVEARVPFLNKNLVKFCFNISPELIRKKNISKYLLKKVAEKYLPKEFIYRPKKGFSAPMNEFFGITSGKEFQKMIITKWQDNHLLADKF